MLCAGHGEVYHMDTTKAEKVAVKVEHLAAAPARNVPYPISATEIQDGWDTLLCKCWLQCADCSRWRNVPEAVRDEVRGASLHASCASVRCLGRCKSCVCGGMHAAHTAGDGQQC